MKRKVFFIIILASLCFLQGCSSNNESIDVANSLENTQKQSLDTVMVKRGDITPTFSTKQTISKATPFSLLTAEKGEFCSWVEAGYKIKAGDVLGYNNGQEIVSPVDAKVVSRMPDDYYPAHYPVIILEYVGFSFQIEATNFLKNLPINYSVKGRFQIKDGIGPTDIKAVVLNAKNTPVESSSDPDEVKSDSNDTLPSSDNERLEATLQALINVDDDVREGQEGTIVLTANIREDVLKLPLSAVAGRDKQGSVTLIEEENTRVVNVTLGVNDGMYIEIISGLEEGQIVSSIPPSLDLRHP